MSAILARDGDCLKLPEKAWLKILCEVMAEGWERKDAHKLTYEDFKLLLPDPQYEAERRQRADTESGRRTRLPSPRPSSGFRRSNVPVTFWVMPCFKGLLGWICQRPGSFSSSW